MVYHFYQGDFSDVEPLVVWEPSREERELYGAECEDKMEVWLGCHALP